MKMKIPLQMIFPPLLLLLCTSIWVYGQQQITGVVTADDGEPLPGVSILIVGTTSGTTTDVNGKFSIAAAPESTLQFSYIGYVTQEVPLNNRTNLDIVLNADLEQLEEVVVVGYGTVKKSDLTGSVSSVKQEEISAFPTTSPVQALYGRAAGVQITQNTGQPGSNISVRIRGTNSIQGSNEPLYVIDGFPFSGAPNFLNNSDIESMEILKDASATAIYGSRGANGVVIITTKKGKAGKTMVDYEGSYSWQSVRNKLDLMNAQEYAAFYNEQATNDGITPWFTDADIAGFETTDWQDVVLRTAPMLNQTINVSGGNEKTQFSVSGSLFDQDGIITNSDYMRQSVRANINHDISKKVQLEYNATLTRSLSNRQNSSGGNRGQSLIGGMVSAAPILSPYEEDGTLTVLSTSYPFMSNVIVNPLNYTLYQTNEQRYNTILANAAVIYKPIDGLSVKISGGIENNDGRNDTYTSKKFINSQGSASISTSQVTSFLNENIVNYTKAWNNHSFSVTGGLTYQDYVATSLGASGSDFISDATETYDIGAAGTLGVPSSSYSKWSLLSYLGRLNYTLNDKYLFTVSFRADGSSRFSEDNKWGYFPSGAFAWRIKDEPFMASVNLISDLKLRLGYGETGSTAISPYQTLNQLASGKTVFGDELYTTYAPGTTLPGDLKWETTEQSNFGIDLGILDNRIFITADYYIKNTRDLLNTVQLPASLGYTSTIQNVGQIQNKGFEFTVDSKILTGEFTWELSANMSFNKSKVVKLYDGQDILGSSINITVVNDNINLLREGEPFAVFYGYVEEGYDENGTIVYTDFNDDGTLTNDDKRIIGDPNPDFIYGLNSTMTYKNFELNIFFQGSQGNDIFNLSSINQTLDYGFGLNMPREVYEDHWTPDNTDAKYPRLTQNMSVNVSDRSVEDGSYMRLRNIQLAYNVPVDKLGADWMRRLQVYLSGQNLLTFTKYSWYDPEISSYGSSNSIRIGIDHYSYPTAKTITAGIKLGF
ncbi:SusC/RagA family TonB-linked outer membrane protein [Chondrinema litorale]|uniref:SusC/RagA family TonB-linked outer membrane protein n=1 Tax=Chondrinema litorale TaxID=2994555 RepID=UPI0025439A99|nr:TonB-dependent receptor [Chondrinema litorale]UZR99552.1 TonB-dependent receptor [Chondrinema litorale]